MGVLGRGLASLIPKRDASDAQDALDQIDKMELEEEMAAKPAAPKKAGKKVSVLEDFEQLDGDDAEPMPDKPLVTPLTLDPITDEVVVAAAVVAEEIVTPAAKKQVSVQEVTDEEEMTVSEEPIAPFLKQKKAVVAEEPAEEVEAPAEVPAVEAPVEVPEPEAETPAVVQQAEEEAVPSFDSGMGGMWDKHEQNVEHIAIGDIKINPLQPRRTFNPQELDELVQSIEQHGILQPLVVRRLDEGGFELIAGERRLRAAKKLGWDKVPAVVRRDVKSDQSRLVFALIENIQRQNLDPIEEALAYKQLNEEYGLTHEEIGARMGKSRVAVTNIVRVLQLPAEIQRGLTEGKITTGHAKAILMIPDAEKQIRFYQHLLDEGLTVRKAEVRARRIQRTMNISDPLRRRTAGRHPLALKYSPILEKRYGYDAAVKYVEEQNKFEITFRAHSEADVDELVGRLMGTKPLATDVDADLMGE